MNILEGLPSFEDRQKKFDNIFDDEPEHNEIDYQNYIALDKVSDNIKKDGALHLYPSISAGLAAEAYKPGDIFRVFKPEQRLIENNVQLESSGIGSITDRIIYNAPLEMSFQGFAQATRSSDNGTIYRDLDGHLNEAYQWGFQLSENGLFKPYQWEEPLVEHAVYNAKYRYPVFIILQHTGTIMSKLVKLFTWADFSHVAVAFNPELSPHFSFGSTRTYARSTKDMGFSSLKPSSEFYRVYKTKYEVYVMFVSAQVKKEIESTMADFIQKKRFWEYDFDNLIWAYFGKATEYSPKYFCSKFVAKIVNIGNMISNKPASLWLPEDFRSIETTTLVSKGDDFKYYNPKWTRINLEHIKNRDYASIKYSYSKKEVERLLPEVNTKLNEAFEAMNQMDRSGNRQSIVELLDNTPPNRVFITSDWHLFKNNYKQAHNEINPYKTIKFCQDNIKPKDVFIYLGDISYKWASEEDQAKSRKIMASIPGTKILVLGNHDRFLGSDYFKDCGFDYIVDNLVWHKVLFTHEPEKIDIKPGIELNIHGHLHNNITYYTTDGKKNINVYPALFNNTAPTLKYLLDNVDILTANHYWEPSNGARGESFIIGNLPLPDIRLVRENQEPKTHPNVYYTREINTDTILRSVEKLKNFISGRIMIKLHFGEKGNQNYLNPKLLSSIVGLYNATLVDCNTAYGGSRDSTREHIEVAKDHGFGFAPLEILDSSGTMDLKNIYYDKIKSELNKIKSGQIRPHESGCREGKHLESISVGQKMKQFDSCIVYTHFKGHRIGGFGGALKNIGIGFASPSGKKQIHDDWHPGMLFQERMVESAGISQSFFDGKIIYVNVLANISMSCDCDDSAPPPFMPDIGVLVSNDPVAIDQACLDLIRTHPKSKSFVEHVANLSGYHQVEYAAWLGLGQKEYILRDLDTNEVLLPEKIIAQIPIDIQPPVEPVSAEPMVTATNEPAQDSTKPAKPVQDDTQNESAIHEGIFFKTTDEKAIQDIENSMSEQDQFNYFGNINNQWDQFKDFCKSITFPVKTVYQKVYYINNQPAGFIKVEATPEFLNHGHGFVSFAVKEQFKRQGLATKMITEMIKDIYKTNPGFVLHYNVHNTNIASQKLARAMGFQYKSQSKSGYDRYVYKNESAINENWIISDKTFKYRESDFISGKTNLAIIVGFSGAGKSTATLKFFAQKHKAKPENIELDYIMNAPSFSDEEVKIINTWSEVSVPYMEKHIKSLGCETMPEYRRYLSRMPKDQFEKHQFELLSGFIKFIKKYAKEYPEKKIFINGIWPLVYYIKPETFDDCCVVIVGTSFIKSTWRAAKRDRGTFNFQGRFDQFMNLILFDSEMREKYGIRVNNNMIRWMEYYKHKAATSNCSVTYEAAAYTEEIKRSELPTSAFGIPEQRKYPLDSEKHVRSAIRLFGHAPEDKKKILAKRIIAKAKKYNIQVPETTQVYKYAHECFLVFAENGMGLLDADNIHKWLVTSERCLTTLNNPWPSMNSAVIGFIQRHSTDTEAYVYTENNGLAILMGQIYINENGNYEWLIQYPLKLSEDKELTSVAEYMGMAGVNPIVGTSKTYLINTGEKNPKLVLDPSADKALETDDSGTLQVVSTENMSVYGAYEYIGPESNLRKLDRLYQEGSKVESIYQVLTGNTLYHISELSQHPYFREIRYDLIEEKALTELSSLYEQAMNTIGSDIGRKVDTTCLYAENSLIKKYNELNDLVIYESPEGISVASRLTGKQSMTVSCIDNITEQMIISVLD